MAIIRLPGLIDVHVHLKDPGQTHKEDFLTGTMSAVCGGFTTVLDMPNNLIPITTGNRLNDKIKIAKKNIVCDIGFYFGSLGNNLAQFTKVQRKVFGLKLYLNITTGKYIISLRKLIDIYHRWPKSVPILVHAEEDVIEKVINISAASGNKTHICHVSTRYELKSVIKAKEKGLPITCGITPHHLFLSKSDADKLGPYGLMKPAIEKGYREYLWKNLRYIDVVESDHAPHTVQEKNSSHPPFGVPGLETTLPLLLLAVSKNKLTIDDIVRLCYTNPKKIFRVPTDKQTYIEVDKDISYIIKNNNLETKCGWSPFAGWQVKGKIIKVVIRNKIVFNNKLIVRPGFGQVIYPVS